MKPKDGGPAFPCWDTVADLQYEGMSLRDWFAGQALEAKLGFKEIYAAMDAGTLTLRELCSASYEVADAMLAAREEKQ